MSSTTMTLRFAQTPSPALDNVSFNHALLEQERSCVRGRFSGAYQNHFTFQWSPAVRALSILMVKARARSLECGEINTPLLSGGAGSPAASLDYAISKQPTWLQDMFGNDSTGRTLAHRIILRTNAERKRGDTVALSLNQAQMSGRSIKVYLHGREIIDPSELETIATAIEADWSASKRCVTPEQPPFLNGAGGSIRAEPLPSKRGNKRSIDRTIRIAVFPIKEFGADNNLLGGFSDEVVTLLSQTPGIQTVAAETMLRECDKIQPASMVSKGLGCEYFITGSSRLTPESLRLNVHIVECETGIVRWAQVFPIPNESITASLQDTATAVRSALSNLGLAV